MPLCASAMVIGALSGSLLSTTSHFIAAILLLCALFAASFILFSRARVSAGIFSAAAVFFAAGLLLSSIFSWRFADVSVPIDRKARILCEGKVISSPQQKSWGQQADVRLLSCAGAGGAQVRARGTARLSIGSKGSGELFAPGDIIRFRASFGPAREMKNPGSFSYRRYLFSRGIGAVASAYGAVDKVGEAPSIAAHFEALRRRIASSIEKNIESPARDIVAALAIGERGGIKAEVRESFAETGLAHLIAISGLHVGFVATIVYFLSRLLFGFFPWLILRIPVRRLAAFATVPAVWGYVMLTGSAVSAVRAGTMITVFMLGVMLGLRQDILSTLAAAVVAILAFSPLSIFDVSFQLSVAAVTGIALVAPELSRTLGRRFDAGTLWGKAAIFLCGLFAVSAAATLATSPIIAWHFKFVTGVSLVANIIAVPLFGALLAPLVALASAVAIFLPALSAFLWRISGLFADLFIDFANFFAAAGKPLVFRFAPTALELSLAYAILLAVVFWRRLPYRRLLMAGLAALVLLDASYWRVMPLMDEKLSVMVIDVGQGDSSLVRFPGGKTMLIDGGGIKGSSFDIGRNVLAPALWRMGIHEIDWVILTHPHYDHYRGLAYIAGEFNPRRIYSNGLDAPAGEAADWGNFLVAAEDAGVEIVDVADEMPPSEVGGVKVEVIKPPVPEGSDINDTSLVVAIEHKDLRFLFTGDLARAGEAAILKSGEDVKADFLKVGHHGSADASSKAFLDVVRPKVAAISAGEYNRYGLPAKDALSRILASGAKIYRTDRDGAITVTSDGKDLDVKTFVLHPRQSP